MITIDEARDILMRSKDRATSIYENEDSAALQAIDYLFVVMDTELLKLKKEEAKVLADAIRASVADFGGMPG